MAEQKHPVDVVGMDTMSPGMKSATNYYSWIVGELAPYLGERILDVGGGYGAHLELIIPRCRHLTSVDISQASVSFMRERFKDYPAFHAVHADVTQDSANAELAVQQFDTITCLNVLEHIEDDLMVLKSMHAILQRRQGTLCILVPAHRWLYGSLDEQAGHFRRYEASQLRKTLVEAGFGVMRLFHFNSFGVFPWLLNARILRNAIDSGAVDVQIKVFDRYIVPAMQMIESRIRPPIGQSLIAIARAQG